ncbi:DNA damage-regulated autophagy modulator protein 1-like isoform X2 [Dysidea avara]|uniref:DNA damage-regulated autophagy modulator protein 1-like isoform X2 n=1 Tax=Dysidea avara TaxID=196820 RepID=UPI003322D754
MWILAKESLRYWIVQGATIVLSTIFVCYGIAVSLGHVPAWLPMISDCAVLPPEKYIFRLGIVIGSVFLAMDSILIYNADKSYSHSKLGLLLGMVGVVGMSIVGVVNEKEDNGVHSTAAVMMYLSYIIYMVVFSFYSGAEPNISTISLIIKRVCAVLGVAIFTAFVFMSTDWDKYAIQIAICEWVGTIAIMVFNLSFAGDMGHLYLCEVRVPCISDENNCHLADQSTKKDENKTVV